MNNYSMHHQTAKSYNFLSANTHVIYFFISSIIFFISCGEKPQAEHYGFLTLLGNDTIAVENVTRQENTLTSDEVDRFPLVRVRHTVIQLNPDNSIKHLVMNIHTPSEPENQRECKVIADVTNDSVHLSKTDGRGTLHRDFATGGAIVVAHVPQMYSLYELYFAAALKHATSANSNNSLPIRQFYIDREFDRFPLGRALVKPLDSGKAEVTHDWLSGTGEATMDSNYHMLRYTGVRTTYKVEVSRLTSPPDIKNIADRFEAIETKAGTVKQLSVRDSVHAQIGDAVFLVDYSRPLMRGRTLLGDVVPYDHVWRTGANAATQFITSAAIKLAGMQVPAGMYTLWTLPHRNEVDLIVNKQTGQWGTGYNGAYNLGTAKFTTETPGTHVEEFTISIVPQDAKHGTLVMEWGNFKWVAPIEVQ